MWIGWKVWVGGCSAGNLGTHHQSGQWRVRRCLRDKCNFAFPRWTASFPDEPSCDMWLLAC